MFIEARNIYYKTIFAYIPISIVYYKIYNSEQMKVDEKFLAYIVLPLIIASFFMSLFGKLNRITYWLKAFIVAWTIVVTFILSLIITENELGAGIITFTLTPIILGYVYG